MKFNKLRIIAILFSLFIVVFCLHQYMVAKEDFAKDATFSVEDVQKNTSIHNAFPIWETLSRHFIIPAN
jgi:hypothetical protein